MKSFAIIGCGRFGVSIAETLYELGYEVLAIDKNSERVKNISEHVTYAVQADAMDESVLKDLGLSNFDVVVVSIGSNLEASIMATLVAKELGAKKIVTKAQSMLHGKLLSKIGADKIVFPEKDMGIRVAHNLTSNNILDYIQLSPDFSIIEVTASEDWYNKTIAELRLRNKYGINIIAIKNPKDEIVDISPSANHVIREGSILVMIGDTASIHKIEVKIGNEDK